MNHISLREQWAGHKKARDELIRNALRTTDQWIREIEDPELGNIGERFSADVERSGCKEEIDIFHNGIADYISFAYGKTIRGFLNKIVCGPAGEEDIAKLFSSKVHEKTHALQKMQSAALHGSPFNPDTKIIICPRDWVLLEERCEQDAYTKQALFNSILGQYLPEMREMTERDSLSIAVFDRIRARSPNIHEALVSASLQALGKSFYSDNPNSPYQFRNHYHNHALNNFKAGMEQRKKFGETEWVFVRVEPEDILAIGTSAGLNTFGQNRDTMLPIFLEHSNLQKDAQDKLNKLNEEFSITNELLLPTLGQVLASRGLTRAQFIESSYGVTSQSNAIAANAAQFKIA